MADTLSTRSNPQLATLPLMGWQGTPVDQNGHFVNINGAAPLGPHSILKWKTSFNPQRSFKEQDTWHLIPGQDSAFLSGHQDGIMWLGHATFLIRIHGVTLLTDPVFGDIEFGIWTINHRKVPFPFEPSQLPKIDYVLISHDHRDHCDEKSLRLIAKLNPQAQFLHGLDLDQVLREWIPDGHFQGAGWYQTFHTDPLVCIHFLPAQHWAKRGAFDRNESLWGAFVIEGKDKTLYFGGDTGYGPHFLIAHHLFPQIDLAILGIGAYSPRWFMSPQHMAPENVVQAVDDLQAKALFPMHYGTFDLSDEPLSEPLQLIRAARDSGSLHATLRDLPPGQAWTW